jgi:hypothetical protein
MELPARFNQQEIIPLVILFGGGRDTTGAHLRVLLYGHPIFVTIVLIWVGILGLSSWVVANRMRRRIKKDIGKTTDEGDLTSLETWMKVDEVEEKKSPGQVWAPESSPSDYESTKRDL